MDDGLMKGGRKPIVPLWTRAARPDELAEVQAIDERLAALRAEGEALARRRRQITNRGCVRARKQATASA